MYLKILMPMMHSLALEAGRNRHREAGFYGLLLDYVASYKYILEQHWTPRVPSQCWVSYYSIHEMGSERSSPSKSILI